MSSKSPFVSIVIPNYNSSDTIGKCLKAVFSAWNTVPFEVIVVDDCSSDNSAEIIKNFPCKFISLERHSGASRARNEGARHASGEVLFFIDSDCLLLEDTLYKAVKTYKENPDSLIGGTYTSLPYDKDFFSTFQSISINYSETKQNQPDYIATHAMIINNDLFKKSSRFREDFLPIIEDVEFSHRLKRKGIKLLMNPEILVQHIFNFSMFRSLKNAVRKSLYWTIYSIKNRDIFKDSGTASLGLKTNAACLFLCLMAVLLYFLFNKALFMAVIPLIFSFNLFINRHFLKAMFNIRGLFFSIKALVYYTTLYALSVGTGSFLGVIKYLAVRK